MLHKVEKAKIEKFKQENVSLKYNFKKKQSLVFKISILYLVFTILNLVLFWVAMGANQYSLLAENANEKARSLSLEFLQRLEPIRTNRTWAQSALKKKDEAFQSVVNLLRKKQGSEKLTTKSFHIVKKNNSNNDVQTLYSHDAESLEVDAELRRQISTAIYKKSKGEPYFREISVLDYTVALYIPLQNSGDDTVLLLTRIKIPKIKEALTQLFIIALGMLIIMLVVQTLFAILIYSIVIKPIKQLADCASEVGQGHLDVEVPGDKKSDEIGLLIYSFNKMVTSLKDKTNKLELIIEELERNNEIMKDVDAFAAKEPRKDDYTLFTVEIEKASEVKVDLIKSGEKLYQEHKFAEAQEVFEKVLANEPGNLTAKLYMAKTLFFLKDYEKAKPFFEEYTAIKSTNAYAHFKLGVCYSKGGEEDKAIAQYENAIKINENLAEAHGQMAISYSNSGELDLAMQNLERALKLQPDDSRLHKIKDKIEQRIVGG